MAATRNVGAGTAASALAGADSFDVQQSGNTRSATLAQVATYVGAAGIGADSVDNTKLANMATATVKGRTTAGTGDPEDLTAAQAATLLQGDGSAADAAGFRGIPQNSQSGNYTAVLADAGKDLHHPSGAGAGDTFTIPANASVAFPLGTVLVFTNLDSNSLAIAITSDTLLLSPGGTTGTRALAQYGQATARKVTSTSWLISGTGLT